MKKLAYKIGVGVATTAILATTLASGTFAVNGDTARCVIRGNGYRSINICRTRVRRTNIRRQFNRSFLINAVGVITNTGGGVAAGNTGGTVDVDSGDSTVTVRIINNVNTNLMRTAGP